MGPVRRRLTAALILLPATAHAETCAQLRPDWATAAITLLTLAAILTLARALYLRRRR